MLGIADERGALWRFTFFGTFGVACSSCRLNRFRSHKTGALLAYLAFFAGRSFRREALADILWPDAFESQSRQSLRTALSALKRQFAEVGDGEFGDPIVADRSQVGIAEEAISSDVLDFETSLRAAKLADGEEERIAHLGRAVGVVFGPFLPGFAESWVMPQQLRFEEEYAHAVAELANTLVELGRPSEAITVAKRALSVAPLREDIHIAAIRAHGAAGQNAEAIRLYEALEKLLDEQWGEEPSAEAVRALDGLPRGAAASPTPAKPAPTTNVGALSVPEPVTRLFGRDAEIHRLVSAFSEPEQGVRLVTLLGPAGCGKTRLAMQLALAMEEHFGPRRWFVELATTHDPDLIADAVSATAAPKAQAGSDPIAHLLLATANEPGLLVLDCAEHIVDGVAEFVAKALRSCPKLRVVVTSRARIHSDGERVYPVVPLALPRSTDDLAALSECPSVALFIDRAQMVRPDFELTRSNAAAVAELCARLEGLPLSIELAAGRAGLMTPSQILGRLAQWQELLVSKSRDTAERHRSLSAAIAWSFELLPEATQRFFRRLSVFRGSWTAVAAERVCEEPNAVMHLERLVECSLIANFEVAGDMQFRMLEAVRQYAEDRLEEEEEQAAVEARHRAYFAEFLDETAPGLLSPDQARAIDAIDSEIDNIRAVMDRALKMERCPALVVRMLGSLGRYLDVRGGNVEWRQRCTAILAMPAEPEAGPERPFALLTAGMRARFVGEHEEAGACFEEALKLAKKHKLTEATALALLNIGRLKFFESKFDEAGALLQEALVALGNAPFTNTRGRILANAGLALSLAGRHADACEVFERAAPLTEASGDLQLVAFNLEMWARSAQATGQDEIAAQLAVRGAELNRLTQNFRGIANLVLFCMEVAYTKRDYQDAADLARQSMAIRVERQELVEAFYSLLTLAMSLAHLGEDAEAARLLGTAEEFEASAYVGLYADNIADRVETRAALAERLGSESFATTLASGRRRTFAEIVAGFSQPPP